MNLSQFITLKMGNKFIFKEPLQSMKALKNNNYMNNNIQNNNYYPQNNFNNNNQRNNQKRNYQGMDIIPKFIANENMQEINKELLERLLQKKLIFNKMINSYFSDRDDNFSNSIQEIETEIIGERHASESAKNKDYDGFMDLLSFINSNRTNPKLTSMQNISLDEYKIMNNETKNQVLGGIYENKPLFGQKLNLKYVNNNNNNNNMNNNPYSVYNQLQKVGTVKERKNTVNNNNAKNVHITQDQLDLFKIFTGNQNISNKEILSYFDMSNPKVIIAAERYFKKRYGVEYLTLQFFYPYQQKLGVKIHKFRFVSELNELFMAPHKDFLSMTEPKLYAENGKQIINDKRIKCLGALGLANNAKIKVIV